MSAGQPLNSALGCKKYFRLKIKRRGAFVKNIQTSVESQI